MNESNSSNRQIIEEICGMIKKLNVQTEVEKQKIINSMSEAIHLTSNSGEFQSSTNTRRTPYDAEAVQHATSATEHKLGTHLDAGCNLYEITELHGKVLTEQLHQANNNSAVCCSEGIQVALDKLINSTGVSELTKQGSLLIEEVKELQKINTLDVLSKIQSIQEERDSAIAMEHKLENEISRLNHEMTIMQTEFKLVDKTRVKALQTQLQALNKERDELRLKNDKLEDALDTLKLMHSLQRSLSKEEDLKSKYERDLQSCKSEIAKLKDNLERVVAERNLVVEERNKILQERNELATQHQEEYERAERCQRLVIALRQRARVT